MLRGLALLLLTKLINFKLRLANPLLGFCNIDDSAGNLAADAKLLYFFAGNTRQLDQVLLPQPTQDLQFLGDKDDLILGCFAFEVSVDRKTIPDDLRSKITAGLAADVIVPTGERTALDYLISPLADKINRSMRER